jgi:hypothetical protein
MWINKPVVICLLSLVSGLGTECSGDRRALYFSAAACADAFYEGRDPEQLWIITWKQ